MSEPVWVFLIIFTWRTLLLKLDFLLSGNPQSLHLKARTLIMHLNMYVESHGACTGPNHGMLLHENINLRKICKIIVQLTDPQQNLHICNTLVC